MIKKIQCKRRRRSKQKTEEERKKAAREASKRWREKNPEKALAASKKWQAENKERVKKMQNERYEKIRAAKFAEKESRLASLLTPLKNRIEALESENKEILLSLDEALKDNKRVVDYIKWGKKPEWGRV